MHSSGEPNPNEVISCNGLSDDEVKEVCLTKEQLTRVLSATPVSPVFWIIPATDEKYHLLILVDSKMDTTLCIAEASCHNLPIVDPFHIQDASNSLENIG